MAQKIKQASIFGRLGQGLGAGLAEQLPKEVERYRLSQGLQQLQKEGTNLSPFERYSRLLTMPGLTPQGLQGASDILRQEAQGQTLKSLAEPKPAEIKSSPFPVNQINENIPGSKIPSITQPLPIEKIQEGYIPPSQDEIYSEAGRRFNENPGLFNNDPNQAISYVQDAVERNKDINQAYQRQHENLSKLQDNVVSSLRKHSEDLGVNVPSNVYSKLEDEAIQATKPKDQGGSGLTEQQAKKEYGKKLDEISRQYAGINNVGNWSITGRKPSESMNTLKQLQKDFEKRDDTKNFGDLLISENSLSPKLAYSIAEPVSRVPDLSRELKKIPEFERRSLSRGFPEVVIPTEETRKLSEKLFPLLGSKGSPLAVAYELEKKGYDPQAWIEYAISHQDKLNDNQKEQLYKPGSFTGTLNDWWLNSWTGVGE